MQIIVPPSLILLAREFAKNDGKLFLVGGYVRDQIMGKMSQDIDICGNLTADIVTKLALCLSFDCKKINKKLGTLKIIADNCAFEYTTFRTETYALDGSHSPIDVTFTNDIRKDANRRDFTINSIYYDIENNTILNYVGGLQDIENRLIVANKNADIIFAEDALRIFRMIRFSTSLNFAIEKNTLASAKKSLHLLYNLTPTRIIDELKAITNLSNLSYVDTMKHLDLFNCLFNKTPSLWRFKFCKRKSFFKYFASSTDNKFLKFCALILINAIIENDLKTEDYNTLLKHCFKNCLPLSIAHFTQLQNFLRVLSLCHDTYNNAIDNEEKFTKINFFSFDNFANSKKTTAFNNIDFLSAYSNFAPNDLFATFFPNIFKQIENSVLQAKKQNIPLHINELKISNLQLLNMNIKNINLTKVKNLLLQTCQKNSLENSSESLKKYVKENKNKLNNL